MSPYQFSLILARGAGILLVFTYIPSVLVVLLMFAQSIAPEVFGRSTFFDAYGWSYWVGALIGPLVGVAILACAPRIARRLSRGCYAPGCCQHCGYRGARGDDAVCPECGHRRTPAAEATR